MRRFTLTEAAERDFRSILRYTRQAWGDDQRDTYADRMVDTMHQLTYFPAMGHGRDDLGAGIRVQSVGHHLILYRLDGDDILILRFLHQRMDLPQPIEG